MSVIATIATETDQSDLRGVIDSLTEHEVVIERTTTSSPANTTAASSSTSTNVFRLQTTESETLLQFHRLCTEHGIQLDVRRIGHERESVTDSEDVESVPG